MTLFGYISGANVGNKEIAMTIPVSSKWTKLSDGTWQKEMCFYLSEEYQANPPQPTNSRVYIVNRPAMTVYTRYKHYTMDHYLKWRQKKLFAKVAA